MYNHINVYMHAYSFRYNHVVIIHIHIHIIMKYVYKLYSKIRMFTKSTLSMEVRIF